MNKLEYRLKSGEKKGAEEGVWKRGSFGNDPALMGHTKPNTFLQKSVGSFICRVATHTGVSLRSLRSGF